MPKNWTSCLGHCCVSLTCNDARRAWQVQVLMQGTQCRHEATVLSTAACRGLLLDLQIKFNLVMATMQLPKVFLISFMQILQLMQPTYTVPATQETQLRQYLSKDYDKNIRPAPPMSGNTSDPLRVSVDLRVLSVGKVDESRGSAQFEVYVIMGWKDDILQWADTDYSDIDVVTYPATEIWLPPFSIDKQMDADLFTSAKESSWVEIASTGVVTWSFRRSIEVGCKIDSFLFPLETHECNIAIISNVYNVMKLIYFRASRTMRFDSWPLRQDPAAWCLYASRISQFASETRTGLDHAGVSFSLITKRPSGNHVIETVTPIVILTLLVLVQFALPPSSQERVTIAGHILIASVLLLLLIWMASPLVAMKTTLHGVYILVLLFLNLTSVLGSVLVVRVYNTSGEDRPPGWMRRLCSSCRKCQPTKPQLHREPSYLSHMQMLRERISTVTAPDWIHERQTPNDFAGLTARPVPMGGYPGGPLPPLPRQYHNMAMQDDHGNRPMWAQEDHFSPVPITHEQGNLRHGPRPNWPEGHPPTPSAPPGGGRPSHSHLEILISRQLHMLRTITETIHNREQEDLNKLEWRMVANVINTSFFSLMLILVLLAPLIIYLLIPNLENVIDLTEYNVHQNGC